MEDFPLVKNSRYQIETPNGFVDFYGIGKIDIPQTMVKILLKSGRYTRVSINHIFYTDGVEVLAKDLVIGEPLETLYGFDEIVDIYFDGDEFVYEVLQVDNTDNTYYANDILNHNCRFLGSQDTVIDADILEMMVPKDVEDLKYGSLLKIYEKPKKEEIYVMGVDAATGVGADYSVIQVLKVIDDQYMEQVATYRYNKISLHDFAQVCVSVGQLYNDAFMLVESNLGGEDLCNAIWYDYEYENMINFDPVKLGIRATPKTKVTGVLNMKRYLENGWLTVVDQETIDELSRFIETGRNKFAAGGSKQHDDLVMGLVWAAYFVFSDEFDELFNEDEDGPKTVDKKFRLSDEEDEDEDYEEDEESAPSQFFFND